MRTLLATLVLASLLLVAACDAEAPTGDAADTAGAPAATPGEAADGALPEGAAAVVDGTEIPAAEVDARVEAATDSGEAAEQLQGEEGARLVAEFRAQTLSVLVQTRIVLDAAEELGAAPTEEEVEQARAELVEQVGGAEAYEEAVGQSGMSVAALDDQLRAIAALDAVGAELVERDGIGELGEGSQADPQELAVQEWLGAQIAAADVVVHPRYGEWNPQTGSVVAP